LRLFTQQFGQMSERVWPGMKAAIPKYNYKPQTVAAPANAGAKMAQPEGCGYKVPVDTAAFLKRA
jgi:hypothetical protein